VVPRLEALLEESRGWTQGKRRLTSARARELLRAEGLEISARRLRELRAEYKRKRQEVYVPLVYGPGELGEVDFFEVWVGLEAERVKAWMFVTRLMHSGRDFAWLYPRQDKVCVLDGHVRAFGHFGGVPHRVVYDNLEAAVVKVLVGSERELNERFVALTNHYLYEASFARPRTGRDKGGGGVARASGAMAAPGADPARREPVGDERGAAGAAGRADGAGPRRRGRDHRPAVCDGKGATAAAV
jgi:transposase